MSVSRMVSLHCDICFQWIEDTSWRSAAEARRSARPEWHRVGPGYDICPDCWAEGKRLP